MDKNELIKNNSDLNISDFDKQLSYDALQGIISAKRNYNKAKSENDTIGMAKANAYANSIRKSSGGYTGGDDGTAFYPYASYSKKDRPEYKSSYSADIDKLYDAITERDDFSYDPYSDPVFALYKKVYEQSGDLAYERALSANAAKTGGIASTNAISAASQAKAYYNSLLAEKAADLYSDAYDRYNDETESLYDRIDLLRSLENDEYKRYLEDADAFEKDRAFEYGIYSDNEKALEDEIRYAVESEYKKSRDEAYDSKWQQEFDYRIMRDALEDSHWYDEMEYQRERDRAEDARWQMENIGNNYELISRIFKTAHITNTPTENLAPLLALLGL